MHAMHANYDKLTIRSSFPVIYKKKIPFGYIPTKPITSQTSLLLPASFFFSPSIKHHHQENEKILHLQPMDRSCIHRSPSRSSLSQKSTRRTRTRKYHNTNNFIFFLSYFFWFSEVSQYFSI